MKSIENSSRFDPRTHSKELSESDKKMMKYFELTKEDFVPEHADIQYLNLLEDIFKNGVKKADRTGTGTYSVFGRSLRFDMSMGFPMLTTKKINFRSCIHELLWMLTGSSNIKYLVDNNVSIWNEWPHKNYNDNRSEGEPPMTMAEFVEKIKNNDDFAKEWGDLGPVYGSQWIEWKSPDVLVRAAEGLHTVVQVNQIERLINDLKKNPDSRRMMVSAWNPGLVDKMVLPSCHYAFQVWTRELTDFERLTLFMKKVGGLGKTESKPSVADFDTNDIPKRALSIMWQQRSVDCGLGLPFDIVLYGVLLHMIAQCVNMVPAELIFNGGDTHVYLNHVNELKKQVSRVPFLLPTIELNHDIKDIFGFKFEDIKFNNYESHPAIKLPISV